MSAPYSRKLYFICAVHRTLGTQPLCGGTETIRSTAPFVVVQIQYAQEFTDHSSMAFLDTMTMIMDQYVNFSSNHPVQPKLGVIMTFHHTTQIYVVHIFLRTMCAWHVWNSWLLIRHQPLCGWDTDTWTWFMIVRKRTPPSETLLGIINLLVMWTLYIFHLQIHGAAMCSLSRELLYMEHLEHPTPL